MTKKQVLRLAALCYGAVLAGWLLWNVFCFASDSLARANGRLQTEQYDFTTLKTEGITVTDAHSAVTVNEDPQLILDSLDTRVTEVRFTIRFSKDPGEVTLFYAKAAQEFSKDNKVWGKARSDGSYVFVLPRTHIGRLRVDPTNQNNISMQLESFVLNAPRTAASYFRATYEDVFHFLVYPGLAAALLGCLAEALGPAVQKKLPRKRSAEKEG